MALQPGSIAYRASQPWPFPQSLMIGFQAAAQPGADGAAREAALREVQVGFFAFIGSQIVHRLHTGRRLQVLPASKFLACEAACVPGKCLKCTSGASRVIHLQASECSPR